MKKTKILHGFCQCGCGEKTKLSPQTRTRSGHVKGEPFKFILGHARSHSYNGPGIGEKNPQWKGDAVGYCSLHIWINKHHPKLGYCAFCKKEGFTEYANISGEYRRDIEDFVELCKLCHKKFDA